MLVYGMNSQKTPQQERVLVETSAEQGVIDKLAGEGVHVC